MQTLNKGEWSEYYVFIKLLADGRIYYGDENLNLIEDKYFDINQVLKRQNNSDQIFYIHDDTVTSNDILPIDRLVLSKKATLLFTKIKDGKKSFAIEEAEKLKIALGIDRFSESAHVKADIRLSLVDVLTHQSTVYGFSI